MRQLGFSYQMLKLKIVVLTKYCLKAGKVFDNFQPSLFLSKWLLLFWSTRGTASSASSFLTFTLTLLLPKRQYFIFVMIESGKVSLVQFFARNSNFEDAHTNHNFCFIFCEFAVREQVTDRLLRHSARTALLRPRPTHVERDRKREREGEGGFCVDERARVQHFGEPFFQLSLKNGPSPTSLLFIFGLFKQIIQFLQLYTVPGFKPTSSRS